MTTTSLRPFERSDYAAFAGVETAEPLIAYRSSAVVIVDGRTVRFLDDAENEWHMEYMAKATAEAVAMSILASLELDESPTDIAERFNLQLI
jgi:Uri superfamily endonuclease